MKLQIDQIAIYVGDRDKKKDKINEVFDKKEWVTDEVKSVGENRVKNFTFDYNLAFNYELLEGGIEFELIEKVGGTSYHDELVPPCISHFGMHVEDLQEAIQYFEEKGFEQFMTVKTQEHTGTSRKYKYTFIDTTPLLGYPLKLIKRVVE